MLLAGGGSLRSFYRIQTAQGPFVVMLAPKDCAEIKAYVDVGRFLRARGIAAPEIVCYDDVRQVVLLEDLGDDSLYSLLNSASSRQEVMGYYSGAAVFLAEMQMKATPHIESCGYLRNRWFGYDALRWETDYFAECFLKRFCRLRIAREDELDEEFHLLACSIDGEPRYFMHRDFQSQNMFVKNGQFRVIDFQTATRGLLQYDLASLLKDAYFQLDNRERDILLNTYMDELTETWGMRVDRVHFRQLFHRTGMQRTMQALGAFAFLGMDRGKTDFLQHIPAALANLRDALEMFDGFPVLKASAGEALLRIRGGDCAAQ